MIPDRLQPLVEETGPLAARFEAAGRRLYLVGGVVRDALLGRLRDDSDLDFTTDARPDETEAILAGWASAVWTQGKRFGTIGARLPGVSGAGPASGRGAGPGRIVGGGGAAGQSGVAEERKVEITTHRAEAYEPDSRHPTVTYSTSIEADLSRRDFTVNAMALSLPGLQLIDPFDGAGDLAAGRLRTPLAPEESFADDPLRMLRAARFVAGYGLTPDDALLTAITTMRARLDIVSDERIRDELDKLMVVERPGPGLWLLVQTGLAEEFLPELPALALEQDPIHRHKDVLAHTIAVVEKTGNDRLLRLAALFHDVGKPKTRSFGPRGQVSFHHHEVVGGRMTRDRMRALRYPTDDIEVVATLVDLHLRFHTYQMGWTDSAVRRYVRDAGPLLDRLNELTRCDCTTRNAAKARALARRMDELVERIAVLREQEELAAIRPDLDGVAVMRRLGIGPGREVGEALNFLLELRLEEGPLDLEEAGRRLDAWWAGRSGA